VDAQAWLEDNARFPVPDGEFACREGCGFCCTYPPKVDDDRLAAIEAARGETPTGTDAHGNTRLALQGGCGGCVLLQDRRCQAHENRPDHCRFFPFHIYFGREVVVVADRVCPGIAPDDADRGPHEPASRYPAWEQPREIEAAGRDVLTAADPEELEDRARQAREAHEAVEAQARWADDWREPGQAVDDHLAAAEVTPRAWQLATEPFQARELAHLPTTVIPGEQGFEWRAWRIAEERLHRLRFDEAGRTKLVGTAPVPEPPEDDLAPVVAETLAALADLEPFVGACMHHVEQGRSMDEAVQRRLANVAAGLSLHADLLRAEDLPVTTAWLRSVYEPEFFTLETLGEWF
jgi:Fe-S-cluster containining protein